LRAIKYKAANVVKIKLHSSELDKNKIILFVAKIKLTYGVYISQLIRYARGSNNYSDFLKRHLHLRNRLLDQGYKKIRLIRYLKKFIFRYQDLVEIYSVSAETIISDAFSHSENV
jgi:hypothetical protein